MASVVVVEVVAINMQLVVVLVKSGEPM